MSRARPELGRDRDLAAEVAGEKPTGGRLGALPAVSRTRRLSQCGSQRGIGIGSRQPRNNSVLIGDLALPLTDRPLPYRGHSLRFVLRGDLSRGAYPQHIPSALYNARPRIALIDARATEPLVSY
jgi:hypothetical protein